MSRASRALYSLARSPWVQLTAPFCSRRESMVITVCLLQPVSGASACTSCATVAGWRSHSAFISVHSPFERCSILMTSKVNDCLP